jgi:hypothetical protein
MSNVQVSSLMSLRAYGPYGRRLESNYMLIETTLKIDRKELLKKLHIAEDSDDAKDFYALADEAERGGKPKAYYYAAFITGAKDDSVTINGIKFRSAVLAENLAKVERVFPYVATCGTELADIEIAKDDLLKSYWLDIIKEAALRTVSSLLQDTIKKTHALKKISSLNPGSGPRELWPIEQQKPLFCLLGEEAAETGVRLTESCLMIPNKSISGIYYASEFDFEACRICDREGCVGRRAAYDRDFAESYRG